MRATTLLTRLLCLPNTTVRDVEIVDDRVRVAVRPRCHRMQCPHCSYSTRHRYDTRDVDSSWRHLDLGGRVCVLTLRRRRLRCPEHGVLAEAVDFARPGSGFTRDFEDLAVWLATKTDKSTVSVFCRITWRTVGAMCTRVAAEKLDPDRFTDLVDIGVDEISWRRHHKYLTLVSDHDTGTIVWGTEGKSAAALDEFFTDALPAGAAEKVEAVSMDLGPAYRKSVREHAPQATICFDPFHVVKSATAALDDVRRRQWQLARTLSDKQIARTYKGARWALLKNPDNLTATQRSTLTELKRRGGALARAYELKEALRAVFAGDLDVDQVPTMLGRWCSWAQRCRIPQFVKVGRTIREHQGGILAAVTRGLANGRHEGLNNKVRLIIRRAYGFHTAENALAMVMLTCGPVTLTLPYHTDRHPHS
ncbi:ISL3 family transposase [Rhodococcus sp. DMU1]|uniref:ISL3 family transposase n=1 Tax=Rhodococcus sp. DMU1 TaxID=2722825 RepID=UPI00143E8811|nr:ISL3 family transposase [Rhodococcus sp. DMU1]QIX53882.1 ISL3 family transposase [Rhodococcus sp. DMU1]QIX53887.1 ISL3 family transposase [Rhodococcus sp. DMU1]